MPGSPHGLAQWLFKEAYLFLKVEKTKDGGGCILAFVGEDAHALPFLQHCKKYVLLK